MKTLLIVNTIILILCLIGMTTFFINWVKSEKKLFKFKQSKLFKNK